MTGSVARPPGCACPPGFPGLRVIHGPECYGYRVRVRVLQHSGTCPLADKVLEATVESWTVVVPA